MVRVAGRLVQYPARVLSTWYAIVLVLGTVALCLPISSANLNRPITVLDALFTAASALCVTGLVVRDTGSDFSFFGQVCILLLIQVGGIGIMTLSTFVLYQLSGVGLRHQTVIRETLGANPSQDLNRILYAVLGWTFLAELIGAVILFLRFIPEQGPWEATWQAVFHSISAFCNAGFSLRANSLVDFRSDVVVNGAICSLVVVGGIGFPVLNDLWRVRGQRWPTKWNALQLHSKLTLIATGCAIIGGAAIILVLEWNRMFREFPVSERILASLFHSVSCRTAGFNTLDLATMSSAALVISIGLMVIGGGACSTAGGVKVSTVSILMVYAASRFAGRKHTNVFHRTISQFTIDRANAALIIYLVVAGMALTSILVLDPNLEFRHTSERDFLDTTFETVSALSTVGLSTGLTGDLSSLGRVVIIIMMFLGRLGPLTVFAAIARNQDTDKREFAHEEPLIG